MAYTAEDRYTQFTTVAYSGRELLKQFSLDKEGFWKVHGEDPNCDLHGPHHQPYIGMVEGKLEDVIRWAVIQDKFWDWGAGGSIEFVGESIPKVGPDTIKLIEDQRRTIAEMEQALVEARANLKKLKAL